MIELPKIFVFPGKLEVSKTPAQFTTILGSCVAVCIWDKQLQFGGMNHFMLPLWNGDGLASPKYGNIAIDKLVSKMCWLGSDVKNLQAKVFGGGNIITTSNNMYNVGERNVEMAFSKLNELGIDIVNSSTGGQRGRKILMNNADFKILHKFIEKQRF